MTVGSSQCMERAGCWNGGETAPPMWGICLQSSGHHDICLQESGAGSGGERMKGLTNFIAVLLTCAVIAITADLFRMAGLSLYTEQYLAGLMALALPLLYLHVPARGRRSSRTGP